MTPDAEALTISYLLAQPSVAAIAGSRIGGRTPTTTDEPWVRVTQFDDDTARARSSALHVVTVFLQLDCYGGDDPAHAHEEASALARTVRDVLHRMRDATHAGAVVTNVAFSGLRRIPDTDLTPARERFLLDAAVTLHPAA